MTIYKIPINNLVQECKKRIYVEKGIQRRVIIISNGSDAHSKLAKALNDEGIICSIDKSHHSLNLKEGEGYEIYKDCYVFDLRLINLLT